MKCGLIRQITGNPYQRDPILTPWADAAGSWDSSTTERQEKFDPFSKGIE